MSREVKPLDLSRVPVIYLTGGACAVGVGAALMLSDMSGLLAMLMGAALILVGFWMEYNLNKNKERG